MSLSSICSFQAISLFKQSAFSSNQPFKAIGPFKAFTPKVLLLKFQILKFLLSQLSLTGIEAAVCLGLTRHREIAYALQIADDAGHVVDILRLTFRTLVQIALVYVSAIVADGVGDVISEIVASFLCCHAEEVAILCLGEVLREVHVQSRATCEVLDVRCAMQLKLVDNVQAVVLNNIEIRVVAVARHEIAVLAVPLGMLHTHVLGRDHLTVEHHVL